MERSYTPSPVDVAAEALRVRQNWSPETRRWRRWLGHLRQRQLLTVLGLEKMAPALVDIHRHEVCLCSTAYGTTASQEGGGSRLGSLDHPPFGHSRIAFGSVSRRTLHTSQTRAVNPR
ncbi:MAG: hypothetical protein ACYC0X_16655 [Pirellulaceae bacterium]